MFDRLQELVRSLSNSQDEQYELLDISFGRIPGVMDSYFAPMEFAIIVWLIMLICECLRLTLSQDKVHPEGLPPAFGKRPLPRGYNVKSVSAMY